MRNIKVSVDDDTYRQSRIDVETERERRGRLLNEVFEDVCATRSGFRTAHNISREALHDRNAVR